ncbi:MAG: hypothetical protein KC502_23960 [Myxococcales bacterium]|nr:hypothetical protein [Myxococcales bacterium]
MALFRFGLVSSRFGPLEFEFGTDAAGERVLLYGAIGSGSNSVGYAKVVNRWGLSSCGAPGACAKKTWQHSDDSADCTADSCTPAMGCTHMPPKANVCDPGMPFTGRGLCTRGACPPVSYGQRFVAVSAWSTAEIRGLTLAASGAPALVFLILRVWLIPGGVRDGRALRFAAD